MIQGLRNYCRLIGNCLRGFFCKDPIQDALLLALRGSNLLQTTCQYDMSCKAVYKGAWLGVTIA